MADLVMFSGAELHRATQVKLRLMGHSPQVIRRGGTIYCRNCTGSWTHHDKILAPCKDNMPDYTE